MPSDPNVAKSSRRPSASIVISIAALILALTGAAYAALGKNTVGSKQIRAGAVRSVEVRDGRLTGADINESTLTGLPPSPIADGAVTAAKIANSAVTSPKIAAGAVSTGKLADGDVTTAKLSNSAVTSAKIADDAVNAAEIANSAVGAGELAPNSLRSSKARFNETVAVDIAPIGANGCVRTALIAPPLDQVTSGDEVIVTPPPTKPQHVILTAGTDDGAVFLDACAIGALADPPAGSYEVTVIQS